MLRSAIAVVAALAAVVLLGVHASSVLGHANYDHSTPGQNQLVGTQPVRVDVWFTQDLNPSGTNTLNVLGPGSVDVDNNDTVLDGANHKHLYITLQTSLPQGTYTVQWVNLSVDGHAGSGQYNFIYGQGSVGGMTNLAHIDASGTNAPHPTSHTLTGGALVAGLLASSALTVAWLARRRLSTRSIRSDHG